MSAPATGPQVGDRVEVTLTGTVRVRHTGKYPSVEIELDADLVSAGRHPEDADIATATREVVTTFAAPDSVVVIERTGGAR